jgi:hypothetical protein
MPVTFGRQWPCSARRPIMMIGSPAPPKPKPKKIAAPCARHAGFDDAREHAGADRQDLVIEHVARVVYRHRAVVADPEIGARHRPASCPRNPRCPFSAARVKGATSIARDEGKIGRGAAISTKRNSDRQPKYRLTSSGPDTDLACSRDVGNDAAQREARGCLPPNALVAGFLTSSDTGALPS